MLENGFYWIKVYDEGAWTIGELENGDWWVIGSGETWNRGEITTIGAKIESPSAGPSAQNDIPAMVTEADEDKAHAEGRL